MDNIIYTIYIIYNIIYIYVYSAKVGKSNIITIKVVKETTH